MSIDSPNGSISFPLFDTFIGFSPQGIPELLANVAEKVFPRGTKKTFPFYR
jgi:hypothetical protein